MRRLGSALMVLGALVGTAAAAWVAVGVDTPGLPWLVSVGLVKLTIVASLGLMAAGAMLLRVERQSREKREAQIGAGEMHPHHSTEHRDAARVERER